MRKPVTFRFDCALLEHARLRAVADNRSLTNFVETAVRRALEHEEVGRAAVGADYVETEGNTAMEGRSA